jgi:endogenous inhibitor of DNA gyrase (YacG/DUF329 family)
MRGHALRYLSGTSENECIARSAACFQDKEERMEWGTYNPNLKCPECGRRSVQDFGGNFYKCIAAGCGIFIEGDYVIRADEEEKKENPQEKPES